MMKWLIWSNEHGAWWAPNSRGYTTLLEAAGRYTKEQADVICGKLGEPRFEGVPDEVAVLAPEN